MLFTINVNCIVWNWFIAKIFLLKLFKMAENKRECFRLEQRSDMKFLVAEKCKSCEI